MKYQKIARAEMTPDAYGGKNFDEHIPHWYGSFYDEEIDELGSIELISKNFPAGTIVTIEIPECPKCHLGVELCKELGECDFDWKKWADLKYS